MKKCYLFFYSCRHSSPLCVTVDVPIGAGDGIPTVFDVIYESISKMKYLKTKRSQMYKEREKAGINAKVRNYYLAQVESKRRIEVKIL